MEGIAPLCQNLLMYNQSLLQENSVGLTHILESITFLLEGKVRTSKI